MCVRICCYMSLGASDRDIAYAEKPLGERDIRVGKLKEGKLRAVEERGGEGDCGGA